MTENTDNQIFEIVLKPKKLRGELSHGMMLVCEKSKKNYTQLGLLTANGEPGTLIQLENEKIDAKNISKNHKQEIEYKDFTKVELLGKDGHVIEKNSNKKLITITENKITIIGLSDGIIC